MLYQSDAAAAGSGGGRSNSPPRSSYSGDFARGTQDQPWERARPVKHKDQLQLSHESASSAGDDRQQQHQQQRQQQQQQQHLQQQQQRQQQQAATAAEEAASGRRQPIRPKGELQLSTAPFEGRSVMQEDFAARQGRRQAPVRHAGELTVSHGEPMAATSTSRDAFTAKQRDGPPPTRRQQQMD